MRMTGLLEFASPHMTDELGCQIVDELSRCVAKSNKFKRGEGRFIIATPIRSSPSALNVTVARAQTSVYII